MTLKPGSFYWVLPVFDVDRVTPGFEYSDTSDAALEASREHWSQKEQPALYLGEDRWLFIGVDEDEDPWPVRWVGEEITIGAAVVATRP